MMTQEQAQSVTEVNATSADTSAETLAQELHEVFADDVRSLTEVQATGVALNACGFGLLAGLVLSILLYKVLTRG